MFYKANECEYIVKHKTKALIKKTMLHSTKMIYNLLLVYIKKCHILR